MNISFYGIGKSLYNILFNEGASTSDDQKTSVIATSALSQIRQVQSSPLHQKISSDTLQVCVMPFLTAQDLGNFAGCAVFTNEAKKNFEKEPIARLESLKNQIDSINNPVISENFEHLLVQLFASPLAGSPLWKELIAKFLPIDLTDLANWSSAQTLAQQLLFLADLLAKSNEPKISSTAVYLFAKCIKERTSNWHPWYVSRIFKPYKLRFPSPQIDATMKERFSESARSRIKIENYREGSEMPCGNGKLMEYYSVTIDRSDWVSRDNIEDPLEATNTSEISEPMQEAIKEHIFSLRAQYRDKPFQVSISGPRPGDHRNILLPTPYSLHTTSFSAPKLLQDLIRKRIFISNSEELNSNLPLTPEQKNFYARPVYDLKIQELQTLSSKYPNAVLDRESSIQKYIARGHGLESAKLIVEMISNRR